MDNNQNTLAVVREITSDGGVTDEEVIHLAKFLNDNVEARETWPGVAITGSTWEFRSMDTFVRVIEKPPADILKLIADWFEERPR